MAKKRVKYFTTALSFGERIYRFHNRFYWIIVVGGSEYLLYPFKYCKIVNIPLIACRKEIK